MKHTQRCAEGVRECGACGGSGQVYDVDHNGPRIDACPVCLSSGKVGSGGCAAEAEADAEAVVVFLGSLGANADVNHPGRHLWEGARRVAFRAIPGLRGGD